MLKKNRKKSSFSIDNGENDYNAGTLEHTTPMDQNTDLKEFESQNLTPNSKENLYQRLILPNKME